MLSSVRIIAAGTTGEESIDLAIAGEVVQTYTNLGDGAYQDQFVELAYETTQAITANDIRIAFTNDLYDSTNGVDRNVRIDAITIDGQRFETEDTSVFSTGTWLPEDGVVPGFRQSEYLQASGYFQYADNRDPGTGTVIINEIHYNPGPLDDPDSEFLELYNPGSEAVDLTGMSFAGFELTFTSGTILGAGQYAIVAPSTAIAEATWGITPIQEFTSGGLAGGGELIQLIAADGVTVVDEVNFDDVVPWPILPDGNGPSLELRDPFLDNGDAESWSASVGAPTPGAINSVFGSSGDPLISNIVVSPGNVLPNESFTVSANIDGATTATLYYRVMFGEEQSIAMNTTGGDVWAATLPGQDAGTLVRYRIVSDVAIAPFTGDTRNYFGIVVSPTDVIDNTLPLIHLFYRQEDLDFITSPERVLTNTTIEAVVAFGDQVLDNATMRVRGGDYARLNYAKQSFKVELPSGYTINFGGDTRYAFDEFGLQGEFADGSLTDAEVAWDVFNGERESYVHSFYTRVESNGDFMGLYRFQELLDGVWRKQNGYDDGQFFEADGGGFEADVSVAWDKKNPDDGDLTAIGIMRDVVTAPPSAAKTQWLYENVEIASTINYMAISALMRHGDQRDKNYYMALDGATGLWEIVPWDLDQTWRDEFESQGSGEDFTTIEPIDSSFLNSMWEVPEFQDLYWRRLQTLVDKYLQDDQLIQRRFELLDSIGATNSLLESQAWGTANIVQDQYWIDRWRIAIETRRSILNAEPRLPGPAPTNPNIVINEIHYNPAGDDAEFLELYNASAGAVDLSGWTIDGVGLTIQNGTVILPGEYVVFTDNVKQFLAQTPLRSVYLGEQYSGGLSGSGEAITLFDNSGNVVDAVTYSDTDPWPTSPDGTGVSLALIDPMLDNAVVSSWQASNQTNGTPGYGNGDSFETSQISILVAGETGNEIIALDVRGERVAIFALADLGVQAGDLQNGNFTALSWTGLGPISASDVRINFINDVFDPAAGIDNNVRIDRIEIDGVPFETEAPSVFSTGTYLPEDGIVPGFRQSEILHANGYFQYGALDISNTNPIAQEDFLSTRFNTAVSGNVLDNDSDPDGDTILVSANGNPSNGSVSIAPTGEFTYTPISGFSGQDSFAYTISDGNGGVATANVVVTVEANSSVLVAGNKIQLLNSQYNGWLASSQSNAFTTTINNNRAQWELVDAAGNNRFLLRNVSTGRYLDGDVFGVDTNSSSRAFGTIWEFQEVGLNRYHLYNVAYARYLDANGPNANVVYDVGRLDLDDQWLVSRVG